MRAAVAREIVPEKVGRAVEQVPEALSRGERRLAAVVLAALRVLEERDPLTRPGRLARDAAGEKLRQPVLNLVDPVVQVEVVVGNHAGALAVVERGDLPMTGAGGEQELVVDGDGGVGAARDELMAVRVLEPHGPDLAHVAEAGLEERELVGVEEEVPRRLDRDAGIAELRDTVGLVRAFGRVPFPRRAEVDPRERIGDGDQEALGRPRELVIDVVRHELPFERLTRRGRTAPRAAPAAPSVLRGTRARAPPATPALGRRARARRARSRPPSR